MFYDQITSLLIKKMKIVLCWQFTASKGCQPQLLCM